MITRINQLQTLDKQLENQQQEILNSEGNPLKNTSLLRVTKVAISTHSSSLNRFLRTYEKSEKEKASIAELAIKALDKLSANLEDGDLESKINHLRIFKITIEQLQNMNPPNKNMYARFVSKFGLNNNDPSTQLNIILSALINPESQLGKVLQIPEDLNRALNTCKESLKALAAIPIITSKTQPPETKASMQSTPKLQ